MATGPKKFRGSVCTKDCSGHRAGYRYAMKGGVTASPSSSSFNSGMNIGIRQQSRPKRRTRP